VNRPASWTVEARIMIRIAERCDDLPLHKLTTDITTSTIESLVVVNAVVDVTSAVEAARRQRLLTFYTISMQNIRGITTEHKLASKGKGKGSVQLLMELRLTATECHLSYGITQVLPATRHKWAHPALTPARQAGTWFTYPGVEYRWLVWYSCTVVSTSDRWQKGINVYFSSNQYIANLLRCTIALVSGIGIT